MDFVFRAWFVSWLVYGVVMVTVLRFFSGAIQSGWFVGAGLEVGLGGGCGYSAAFERAWNSLLRV